MDEPDVPNEHGVNTADAEPGLSEAKSGAELSPEFRERIWKPGQSGNPKGRPKGRILTEELIRVLDKPARVNPAMEKVAKSLGLDADKVTILELLVFATLVHGLKGNASVLDQLWNRTEGKVADRIAGHDGGPVSIQQTLERVLSDPAAMAKARALANEIKPAPTEPSGEQEHEPKGAGDVVG